MALFADAEHTNAYLKMGLFGFAGAGKTFTATMTATGLVQHMREHGIRQGGLPIYFIDTETGSDFVKDVFDEHGIVLRTLKTRAFKHLLPAVEEAEQNGSVLIIDSISHFWSEFLAAYQARKNRRILMQDWGYLKGEWGKFTNRYINSDLHIIMCGRAGFEFDHVEDEAGKKQMEKSGVKMRAESEMGFEPSLLVFMEREQDPQTHKVSRIAHVMKDRWRSLDGQSIRNPTFKSFASHIERLNLGGKQLGVDNATSVDMIPKDEARKDWSSTQRKIVLEEVQALATRYFPSTSGKDKQAKAELIRTHFGTESWTEISEVMPLNELRHAYDQMHRALEDGLPSRYFESDAEIKKLEDSLADEARAISEKIATPHDQDSEAA